MTTPYTIETDALPDNANRIAKWAIPGLLSEPAIEGGRLGTIVTIDGHDQADAVARELREYGYEALMDEPEGG